MIFAPAPALTSGLGDGCSQYRGKIRERIEVNHDIRKIFRSRTLGRRLDDAANFQCKSHSRNRRAKRQCPPIVGSVNVKL